MRVVRVSRDRVVGSGIVVGDGVKLLRIAKRSFRFVWPSWFASPFGFVDPKCFIVLVRSVCVTWLSPLLSPRVSCVRV